MSGMIGQNYCLNNPGFPLGFMPCLQFLTIQIRGSLQWRRRHREEKTSWTSIQAAQTTYLYHCIDFKVNVQSFSPVAHSCMWSSTDVSPQPQVHPAFTDAVSSPCSSLTVNEEVLIPKAEGWRHLWSYLLAITKCKFALQCSYRVHSF